MFAGKKLTNEFTQDLGLDFFEPFSMEFSFCLNLEKVVQGNKVMQNFELESFSMGVDHSLMVKATPIESDYSSEDCVNLLSSTAVSRLNELVNYLHPYSRLQATDQQRNLLLFGEWEIP